MVLVSLLFAMPLAFSIHFTATLHDIHAWSDFAIGLSYFTITMALAWFFLRYPQAWLGKALSWTSFPFIAFCGAHHFVRFASVYYPVPGGLSLLVNLATAGVSWMAVGAVVMAYPKIREAMNAAALLQGIWSYGFTGVMALEAVTDDRGEIVDFVYSLANPRALEIMGMTQDQVIGMRLLEAMPAHRTNGLFEIYKRATLGETIHNEFLYEGDIFDKRWFRNVSMPFRVKEQPGFLVTFEEITNYKQAMLTLEQYSLTDELTGLYTRRVFRSLKDIPFGALLYVDLNKFKQINDTLGHNVGDRLLEAVASRLRSSVKSVDTVARVGGDEFVVLLRGEMGEELAIKVADRIARSIERPFLVEGKELLVAASVGVAVARGDETIEQLLQQADVAMYQSKFFSRAGSVSKIVVYQPDMLVTLERQTRIEEELSRGIERQELVLHYQPLVDLQQPNRPIVGFEALVRWNHPTRGLLYPGEFIEVAERSNLIYPLFDWVFQEACRQSLVWSRYWRNLTIAVNVSVMQLARANFTAEVATILRRNRTEPGALHLEITESALGEADPEIVDTTLLGLKGLSLQLAIDDFGTGASSLSRLADYPVDLLKIDRRFMPTPDRPQNREICDAVVRLAFALGLKVVAEGIETEEQAEILASLGSHYGQGYFFAKPQPAEVVEKTLGLN